MDMATARAVGAELEIMKDARAELGTRDAYLSTAEAVRLCAVGVSEETLISYPGWILPRVAKNPRARRPSYMYDPRDIAALPIVLRLWEQAISAGREAGFAEERVADLAARDEQALRVAMGRAA